MDMRTDFWQMVYDRITSTLGYNRHPCRPLSGLSRRCHTADRVVELVDGEERLPFTVTMLGKEAAVTGYVRIADNAIFLFRPEKKDHIRSTLDPRFAPPKEVRIEPEKPA